MWLRHLSPPALIGKIGESEVHAVVLSKEEERREYLARRRRGAEKSEVNQEKGNQPSIDNSKCYKRPSARVSNLWCKWIALTTQSH